MHKSVDGARGGHRVFEDFVPLREDQVRGHDHTSTLIPLCEKRKENVRFVPILLDVTDVIDDDDIESIQSAQRRG